MRASPNGFSVTRQASGNVFGGFSECQNEKSPDCSGQRKTGFARGIPSRPRRWHPRSQRVWQLRRRAVGYVRGLLGDAVRKNGWQMAEALGEATPDGVQHLLVCAGWDADAVLDALFDYVAESLGAPDGGAGRRCDRVPQEGREVVRGGPPVLGHRRADREQPGRWLLAYAGAKGHPLIDRACTCRRSGQKIGTAACRLSPDRARRRPAATAPGLTPMTPPPQRPPPPNSPAQRRRGG